ncbi:MAG: adenylate/guanylate cyclase domain-containing protein [Candidatus Scalindua sp.]|jgi:adenylate cyclase|nr:adenylate/guanylate cyclase domain-containing protein [Candidatus Scalindua sp.]MBT5306101.1 adenylate/guanylate cyclase domain-containing protein [Candidatus Scalindua sp.]MBT6053715.1 adenylate/guanylate cyclase domain-containing protein [Candidatus Scalindua sp.]MBT6228122.1 adenylate/guanylate cyclase domain-containing protein [Candidatus Scalindua sp.]MBT6564426.1 adenylate/guanylate cyclase domain-containing protein [Candidatus Scalindua sp.]
MKLFPSFLKVLKPGTKVTSILISILTFIIVIVIYNLEDRDTFKALRIFKAIEQKSVDVRFQIRGKRDPGNEIVIVSIDEKSIKKLGRYPWPRRYIAEFVDKITEEKARLLALDVIYSETQNDGILKAFDTLTKEYNDSTIWKNLPEGAEKEQLLSSLYKKRKRFDEDTKLKEAFKRAVVDNGMDIISAIDFVYTVQGDTSDLTGKEVSATGKELLKESAYFPVLAGGDIKSKEKSSDGSELTVLTSTNRKEIMNNLLALYRPKRAVGVLNMIDPFAEWVTYQGFVDTNVDYSGIVRSEYMAIHFENEFYPPLGVQVARVYKNINYGELKLVLTEKLIFKETEIPIDSWNRMMINYCGPEFTFNYFSFCDVIEGKIPPDTFNNKIVFLGATASGLGDFIATPFSSQTPGVEKHATVTENILHEKFVVRGEWEVLQDVIAILCISLALGIFLPLLPAIWGAVASTSLWFGYNYYVYERFINDGTWLNVTYPSVTVILCFSSITLYRFISEEKLRKGVKSAFENFMDPKVVHEILKEPEDIKLGGEEREVTVYFSDIEKFSSISEKLQPAELIELLNEYLSEMTDQILDHGGFLDKYIGDAIVAAFGTPLEQPDHAVKACLATIDNQKRLRELNVKFKEEGRLQIKARIGLNSGRVLVGNVGSMNRLSYTVIGDEVNLGARLEAANKYYGTYTMISESTYELAKDHIEARELDMIRVVGKEKPVKVYELIDRKGEVQEAKREVLKLYEDGLKMYRKKEWQKAISMFQKALNKDPHDGPSLAYIERCKIYVQDPPPENWDGVYVLTEK